jgi:ubiquinone/menaquinone biosynthesis C-methylase UbiE
MTNPQKNIEQFYLKEGMRVADLGAGMGVYSIAAAKKVGDKGKVYAVEVQKDFLQKIKNEAKTQGVGNIEVLWGDIEELGGTKIADNEVDAVILSNVLFQVENPAGLLSEAKRILIPGGSVLVVDWADSFGGLGPQLDDVIPLSKMKSMLNEAGFIYDRDIETGEHHYGLVATKA